MLSNNYYQHRKNGLELCNNRTIVLGIIKFYVFKNLCVIVLFLYAVYWLCILCGNEYCLYGNGKFDKKIIKNHLRRTRLEN